MPGGGHRNLVWWPQSSNISELSLVFGEGLQPRCWGFKNSGWHSTSIASSNVEWRFILAKKLCVRKIWRANQTARSGRILEHSRWRGACPTPHPSCENIRAYKTSDARPNLPPGASWLILGTGSQSKLREKQQATGMTNVSGALHTPAAGRVRGDEWPLLKCHRRHARA